MNSNDRTADENSDSNDDKGYRVLNPGDVSTEAIDEFANAVLQGLSENPKRLSSQFIYDDLGSQYFREIMALEEYYPTRCETEILTDHAPAILDRFSGSRINLVDLGAGDGVKTRLLLQHLAAASADFAYVPIDISESAMAGLAKSMRAEIPGLRLEGLVAEYSTGLRWLNSSGGDHRNLVLFLGSNIGNFNRASSRSFLRRLWSALNPGDCVLIGFDLKKDIDLLLHAYNDSKGVTAKFNLNLLTRINRELGGNFDLEKFRHYATYDVFSGAMESYVVSSEPQVVTIDAIPCEFTFEAWEPVHTEYSYKFLDSDITALASDSGFVIEDSYYDSRRWFTGSLWRVEK